MKINQELHLKLDKISKEQKSISTGNTRFQSLVQKQDQKLQYEALNKLLVDIEGAGERMARSRTFKDLAKYKNLVKKFVKEAVNFGMELKQSHSWNQFGQSRPLKTVETIDQKLVELTEDVMNKEKESIDILGKIGEVKGLLINLYT
ncbi:YaaR family protein [Peribacillus alkalitolerans]|uniref:YaaR family protein n=1 Tax=Peribacillus alkalitolerans TaxID=1550385 RepID=UPI0013D2CCC8|nr:YaaR family protein [Peribacillus alkalitolerans]